MAHQDKELEEFRSIMEVPTEFEDGFSWTSLVGTLFLALVLVPGCLYMELIAGMGIGPAAQWVTVILFIEVAKRANQKLSRAQLFVLFYITGMIVGQTVHGTPLFRQFVVRSEAAVSFGISAIIPTWVAPTNEAAYANRTFFQWDWLAPIALMVFGKFFGSLNQMILGYGLFRQASDIEKLPFPMAPIRAQGIAALAEEADGTVPEGDEEVSRWRMFCIGGAIGMAFNVVYMGLPTLTGAIMGNTVKVFPIPFADFSTYTKDILPAVATGISFNLGQMIIGMVMPFYAILGSFLGMVLTMILNPILYNMEVLTSWSPGDSTVEILFNNNIDLYFSLGIGLSLAIAVIGLYKVFHKAKGGYEESEEDTSVPEGRGDLPNWLVITFYILSTSIYVIMSGWLMDWHPGVLLVLLFYGILYTPIISYVTARLEGICGQVLEIPFIKELSFILCGYTGVAIWFIPVPKGNYGAQTVFYKKAELLGTSFKSIWKTNLILMPIVIISTICFSSFIWGLAEIPSSVYPYTQEIWEFEAKNACLLYASTLGEYSIFEEALSANKVAVGFGVGLGFYGLLAFFSGPTMLFYGLVRGLGAIPHITLLQFIGAVVGRLYFKKKFGKQWLKMIPVVSAGFMVGGGLIGMFCIGIVFLAKATTTLPY
ncbi:MAG: peptide transporter [Planctomycetota bacterium]|jgi:hypothetical protein